MMRKEDYLAQKEKFSYLHEMVAQDSYRMQYHLMAPTGWLNDPNGLCQWKGVNQIYFQYSPFTAEWGEKLWGHYTTRDWIHFEECEPFLFPDTKEDRDGVYSGCAFPWKDEIHYFYTGNVKYTDKQYDYINQGREQNTIEVVSKDGFTYSEKKVVLKNSDYPMDMSAHVRDPKVFCHDDVWYMVLGARTKENQGCVLIYRKADTWEYHMRIEAGETYGYMWECPDLIQIDGKWFLMCCPQGMKQEGWKYQNVYQCGYFSLDLDLKQKTYEIKKFYELDHGFDIYATQSYVDEAGRRILIGWLGIPDATYHNKITVEHGWQHALTMPRVLHVKNDQLIQTPLDEMKALYGEVQYCDSDTLTNLEVHSTSFVMEFNDMQSQPFLFQFQDLKITYEKNLFKLSLKEGGLGRNERVVELTMMNQMQLYVDNSCVEVFINEGEVVLTTRWYRDLSDHTMSMKCETPILIEYHSIHAYQITKEGKSKECNPL